MGDAPTLGRIVECVQQLKGLLMVDKTYPRSPGQLNDPVAVDCDPFTEKPNWQLPDLKDSSSF
jgi:hypothetical protein